RAASVADRLTLEIATPTRLPPPQSVGQICLPGGHGELCALAGPPAARATRTRLVATESVDEIVIPGSQGYFGVLPGHAPLLTTLGIGELMYRVGRDERYLAVSGGFAEVRNDKVIVLADTAERPEEIDRARAERARERAERRLARPGAEEG